MRPKKRSVRRSPRRIHRGNFMRFGIGVAALALVVVGTTMSPSTAPLSPLPVPAKVAQVAYSGPLTLSSVNVSVLGAQTIDPVDFINEINKERQKVGSPPLRLSTVLMKAAKMRVEVIGKHQHFSHQDPYEGIELTTVLPKLGYHFVYATENIGMGGVSAVDFVNGFMHSTYHRENLLDSRLTETGAAIVDGPYKQYYVNYAVQLFAIPGGQDEYLGYTQMERTRYEEARSVLAVRLNPVRRIIQQILRKSDYTEKQMKKYSRQRDILETVLTRMRNNEPLESRDVALILEYNTLL